MSGVHIQPLPQIMDVMAFTPTTRGVAAELDPPRNSTPLMGPPDQLSPVICDCGTSRKFQYFKLLHYNTPSEVCAHSPSL